MPVDPTSVGPLISWVASLLPAPWSGYFLTAAGLALLVIFLCSRLAAWIKPPAADAANWLRTSYHVISVIGGNTGWARNAVVPGMPAIVQQAALASAKVAAAAPEQQVIAGTSPTGAAVIAPAIPVSAVGANP